MDAAGIKVEGAKELRAHLRDIGGKDLLGELKGAHKKVSEMLANAARPNAPVLTGALQKSVKPLASQRDARVKAGVPYAAAIHWGRKKRGVIVGRPFILEAAQRMLPEAAAMYEHDLTELINRHISS